MRMGLASGTTTPHPARDAAGTDGIALGVVDAAEMQQTLASSAGAVRPGGPLGARARRHEETMDRNP